MYLLLHCGVWCMWRNQFHLQYFLKHQSHACEVLQICLVYERDADIFCFFFFFFFVCWKREYCWNSDPSARCIVFCGPITRNNISIFRGVFVSCHWPIHTIKSKQNEIEWEFDTSDFVIFTRVKWPKVPNPKIMFLDFCVFDVRCSDLPAYSTEKKTTHWTVRLIRWAEGDTFSTPHKCLQKYNMTQHQLKANLVHFCFSVFCLFLFCLFFYSVRFVCLTFISPATPFWFLV